jgi:DnaJ-class molecular chaperone
MLGWRTAARTRIRDSPDARATQIGHAMTSHKGPNIKKKQKCKNCEGKGTLKKGDKVVTCQRCKGTGVR